MDETNGTTNETSAGCRRRRRLAPAVPPPHISPLKTPQCLSTPQRRCIRLGQVLASSHPHKHCVTAAADAKSSRQLTWSSEHPRVSLAPLVTAKSCTPAGIVIESDQAAFVRNHTYIKADVTCTTDAATNEDGPSLFERTHAATHYHGNACRCSFNRTARCVCVRKASQGRNKKPQKGDQ